MCLQLLWSQVVKQLHQRAPADVVPAYAAAAGGLGPASLRALLLTGHEKRESDVSVTPRCIGKCPNSRDSC